MSVESTNTVDATPSMTTGKAVIIYAAALFVLILLIAIVKATGITGWTAFCGYLILGFLMNRVVLRGLIEWHPVYNTLENVSSAKLGMLIFWPLRYPVLFFKLLVVKHL